MEARPFLMVSGFHRSGTSLVAQTLQSNGVNMGNQLMGASFGNPNGHVEDIPLVNLHDQMLNANGQDWRCTLTHPLPVPNMLATRQKAYIASRIANSNGEYLGAKDPRALHFLPSWDHTLKSNIAFLIVFRDWRFSVSSLLKRHSRELMNALGPFSSRPVDFEFWQQPDLAAKMWLASAKLTLKHCERSVKNTLLFPLEALTQGNDILFKNAASIGIPPSLLSTNTVVTPELLQSSIPHSAIDMVSQSLIDECDALQSALYEVGGFILPSKTLHVASSYPLSEKLLRSVSPPEAKSSSTTPKVSIDSYSVLEALALYDFLEKDIKPYFPWSELVDRDGLSNSDRQSIFEVAQKHRILDVAEIVMQRAINISPAPWRWMHLGDVYLLKKMPSDARQCFLTAQKASPTNATFYAKLADVEIFEGKYTSAAKLIERGQAIDASKTAIVQSEKRLALALLKAQNQEARNNQFMPIIDNYESVVTAMTDDKEYGLKLDEYLVKSTFVARNSRDWLTAGLSQLAQRPQRCLADFLCLHLQRYWSNAVLETELLNVISSNEFSMVPTTFSCDKKANVGVHIHVYYVTLIPEILSFLNHIPVPINLVVTCPKEIKGDLAKLFPHDAHIIACQNRGRDIAPWLLHASPLLQNCDLALKIHTKSTLHEQELSGWRLQLLWSLLGSKQQIEENLDAFNDESLGLLLPQYHPSLKGSINWGKNRTLAIMLGEKLNLVIPDEIDHFPAGSMFWYRPSALTAITHHPWKIEDFPIEDNQVDGTVMHALERLIGLISKSKMISLSPQPSFSINLN